MRATVMRDGVLVVDEVDAPRPGPGEILVRTLACGICGSDLHALQHGHRMVEMAQDGTAANPDDPFTPVIMSLDRDVVMGHEFSAEVIEVGQNIDAAKVGTTVVSVPVAMDVTGIHPIGYSNTYSGGFGELMVLSGMLAIPVPNRLDPRHAALTEPMAVGLHAVRKAAVTPADTAIVLGCGPVGLAVVAALRLDGVEAIVAADPSPTRRALAATMGAAKVVDPQVEAAVDAWRALAQGRPLVIFEAVGVPGMLDDAMRMAPRGTEIVVVGVCMEPDTIRPMRGVVRELTIHFSLAYDPIEFAATLRHIAEGSIDVAPLITGEVPIDGIPGAFEALADPDAHAKILVVP